MQVNIESIKEPIVICMGNFDGVHKGHQELIKAAVNYANEKKYNKALFTFENHSNDIVSKRNIRFLQTYRQKIREIRKMGIDYIIHCLFDDEIMQLTSEEFVEILIEKYNIKAFFVGFDYRYGFKALGNPEILKRTVENKGIEVFVLDSIDYDGSKISSTRIRECIQTGEVKKAQELLGRNYAIEGKVIEGIQLGRKMGFPTANIDIYTNYIIPKSGVYMTKINIDNKTYYAVTNVGNNPTIRNKPFSIETHIINFDNNIYGIDIEIEFLEYIREEIKFDSIDDLKEQINKDVKKVVDLRVHYNKHENNI